MTLLQSVKNAVRQRSIHVCYVDTGSCNGCDIEVLACLSPRYDLEQYGIYVHNNPREADVLLVIGGVTPQWEDKLKMVWDKIPEPKVAVSIGNCPISGCVFSRPQTLTKAPAKSYIPIAAEVPGCPPRPTEIIQAILSVSSSDFQRLGDPEMRKTVDVSIPLGPVHPIFKEPCRIKCETFGEQILAAEVELDT